MLTLIKLSEVMLMRRIVTSVTMKTMSEIQGRIRCEMVTTKSPKVTNEQEPVLRIE